MVQVRMTPQAVLFSAACSGTLLVLVGGCSESHHELGSSLVPNPDREDVQDAGDGAQEDDEDAAQESAGEGSSDGEPSGDCTERPGTLRGKSRQRVDVGGAERTFVAYVPEDLDPSQPTPLVIAPHGFAMTGETMYEVTGFKELSDREQFAVVFPDGESFFAPWNVGEGISGGVSAVGASGDDQGFLDAIIDFVDRDLCLDRDHVFVSGFSMGGYFSNEVGCLRSDVASVGPHSGGSHDLAECEGSIKPVILFHGVLDAVVPYEENALLARDRWLERNGCDAAFDEKPVKGGSCEYYQSCPERAQVVLCHFEEMGHTWAGGVDGLYGNSAMASAAELAWKFWQDYAW